MRHTSALALSATLLVLLCQQALASVRNMPYQVAFLYYAYRIDVKVNGAMSTKIAPGCIGTAPDGSCNMAEFVHHIHKHTSTLPAQRMEDLKRLPLLPEILDVVKIFKVWDTPDRINNDFKGILDVDWLFTPGTIPRRDIKLIYVFEEVTNIVQSARKSVKDAGLKDELGQIRLSVRGMLQSRLADMGSDAIVAMNKFYTMVTGLKYKVKERKVILLDGEVYRDVDLAASAEANSLFKAFWPQFENWLKKLPRRKMRSSPEKMYAWHMNTFHAVKPILSRIEGSFDS